MSAMAAGLCAEHQRELSLCTSGLDGLGHIFVPFTHGPAVSDTRCARPRGQALCIGVSSSPGLTRMDVKRSRTVRKCSVLTRIEATETLVADDCFSPLHLARVFSLNNNKSINHNKPVGREVFN